MHTELPALTRHSNRLAWRLLAYHRAQTESGAGKTFAGLALRYYVGRWDLIPDFVPGIGLLDDYLFLKVAAALLEPPEVEVPSDMAPAAVLEEIEKHLRGKPSSVID